MDIIKAVNAFEFLDIGHHLDAEESELAAALFDHLCGKRWLSIF